MNEPLTREQLEQLFEKATELPADGTALWTAHAALFYEHGGSPDCGVLTAAIIQEALEGGGDGETCDPGEAGRAMRRLAQDCADFAEAIETV